MTELERQAIISLRNAVADMGEQLFVISENLSALAHLMCRAEERSEEQLQGRADLARASGGTDGW